VSDMTDQLLALAKHTGAPDVVEDAAHMLKSLEGVRAERDVLQEIVDEQRAQIAQLVSRVAELTAEVAEVREERRVRLESLHAAIATARRQRDEARREAAMMAVGKVGKAEAVSQDARAYAMRRGWDCFPEATP
jgi:chromosome segregation ATPase